MQGAWATCPKDCRQLAPRLQNMHCNHQFICSVVRTSLEQSVLEGLNLEYSAQMALSLDG